MNDKVFIVTKEDQEFTTIVKVFADELKTQKYIDSLNLPDFFKSRVEVSEFDVL